MERYRTACVTSCGLEVLYDPEEKVLELYADGQLEAYATEDHDVGVNPYRAVLQRLMDGEAFEPIAQELARELARDRDGAVRLPMPDICARHLDVLAEAGMNAVAMFYRGFSGMRTGWMTWDVAPAYERDWARYRVQALLRDNEDLETTYEKRRQALLAQDPPPSWATKVDRLPWEELGPVAQQAHHVFVNAVEAVAWGLYAVTHWPKSEATSQPAPPDLAET